MFNSKLFFSLAVFTFFLIITSLVKNQSRIIEKQIKSLNINIIAKEKNISEAEMEFSYLSSPNPMYDFPGLKAGNKWCLCALRWKEALIHNVAPKVILEATNEETLKVVNIDDLIKHSYKKFS